MKDASLRKPLIVTAFGVCLYVALTHIPVILQVLLAVYELLYPVLLGGIYAFILNIPMSGIEKRIPLKGLKKRFASLALTLILFALVIALLIIVIVPQVETSITQLYQQAIVAIPEFIEKIKANQFTIQPAVDFLQNLDVTKIFQQFSSEEANPFSFVLSTVSSTAGYLFNVLLAIVFCIYFLISKELLAKDFNWLAKKTLPEKIYQKTVEAAVLLQSTFSKFISGQCIEAVLLGIFIYISFTICGLPYAGLIAAITAITSFIPYIGAFIACALGAIFIAMISPWKAFLSIIVYEIVQFMEDQFVYPKIVGTAVGLPAVYTIVAFFIGGATFGIAGMIFVIPVAGTFYTLIKKSAKTEEEE